MFYLYEFFEPAFQKQTELPDLFGFPQPADVGNCSRIESSATFSGGSGKQLRWKNISPGEQMVGPQSPVSEEELCVGV